MKYQALNVLNQKKPNLTDRIPTEDAITQVANMINSSGQNRSQRRRLEKSLKKVETIQMYAQNHVDRSAYEKYAEYLDQDFVHFFAIAGITMVEKYGFDESIEDDDGNGQVTLFFKELESRIKKYMDMGYTTDDVAKVLYDLTGLDLVAKGGI